MGGVEGGDAIAVEGVQAAQGVHALVQYRDIGAEAHGHGQGMGTDHATAEYHHLAGSHAGDTAEQDAAAALGFFQAAGAGLD
ncbi:hypothetical protein D9M71_641690 [compost metagenome]